MPTFLHVIAARIRAFLRPGEADRDFTEELEAHLALAEEDKIRQGMAPEEARRQARMELGGVTRLREAGREARGLPRLDTYWLDCKLGFRMLRKSWGLTLVGGLAMTLAIGVGVFVFWFLEMVFSPTLPLEQGSRVVALQTWDEKAARRHETSLLDYERWRDGLRSVEDFGAFQAAQRNLATEDGRAALVTVAEMTASGFRLARAEPMLGRPLVEADEREGAPPVVVVGHDAWRSRFLGDPSLVGKTVSLGGTAHTVVGVMPEGFAFPMAHSYWTPLKPGRSEGLRGEGPEGVVFARLAPGFTVERAQAELASLGLLSPAAAEAEKELRPRVVPYTFAFTGDFEPGQAPWVVRVILFLVILLLIPPCANIAILVYARTITRQEEFAARFALGASRGRIVGQLTIELLVLAACSAGAALVIVGMIGAHLRDSLTRKAAGGLPFWIDFELSPRTVLFAAALALVAALIAGAVPALKATGRKMQSGFRGLGGSAGIRLGGTWTALVVAQVALTLAALPAAVEVGWGTLRSGILGPGFPAEEYLAARVAVDRETLARETLTREGAAEDERPFAERVRALQEELVRALQAEALVQGVSLAASVPGAEPWAVVEVEGVETPEHTLVESREMVQRNRVDAAFFEVFDTPFLAGRGFEAADFRPGATALIVDETFVQALLGERDPLGRRVRYVRSIDGDPLAGPQLETWHEIVGVVADQPAHATHGTIYHPLVPGTAASTSLALRVAVEPAALADRLREVGTALGPALRIEEVRALDAIYRDQQVGNNVGAFTLALVTSSVLLLSVAGIYALMSFTVNHRRREIGIRTALGAQPHRVLADVFRRAVVQVGIGALAGSLVALLIDRALPIEEVGGWSVPGVIPAAAVFMLAIACLAASGPARQGLEVDPIEELREG